MLRVPDEWAYYKEDAGKMMLGAFEPDAKPWGMEGVPEDFCFDQLPEDVEHFAPVLEKAIARMPMLAEAGIRMWFCGPESFTPDDRYYLGEAPELRNYFVACGYNSIGIVSSGGAGMALARWIDDGEPPFDLWEVDIRRAQPFQKNRRYLKHRVSESLGLLYADHFPYRQPATARGVRRSPVHEQLEARGACFGETAGWERADWFAPEGATAEYRYSWKRQNWFDYAREEHLAVRAGVGLFDMTSFGKIRAEGPRRRRRAEPRLRQRDRRRAGPAGLHPVPEPPGRDRVRLHGDAPVGDRLPDRHAGRDADARHGLAQAPTRPTTPASSTRTRPPRRPCSASWGRSRGPC